MIMVMMTVVMMATVTMMVMMIIDVCIYLDSNKWNRVLNIGGPDDGMTMKQQVSDVLRC